MITKLGGYSSDHQDGGGGGLKGEPQNYFGGGGVKKILVGWGGGAGQKDTDVVERYDRYEGRGAKPGLRSWKYEPDDPDTKHP